MTQRAITVLLTAVTGPYVANMGRAAGATSAVGTAAQTAKTKTSGLSGAMGGMAGKLVAGGGLLFALKQNAEMLMSYESALVGVGKTTGLAGDELGALGDQLTDLAKNIGGSAEDMLGIAQSAAQLGVSNENIVEFTEVIANMASATDLTVDSAATDMARLSNVLGRPIEDVESLGSSIVALGNNMATTEPEILNLSTRLAAAGRTAGLSDSDVVGLAAAMSSLGIEAEAGGTAMSRVLNEVTKAVGVGSDEVALFAQTAGMSAQEFTDAWAADPQATLQAFLEGLGQLSEGDRFTVMEELGLDAARLTDVLLRTSSGAEGLADAFALSETAMEENVALAEEAATANATLSTAVENLGDTLKDAATDYYANEEGASVLAQGVNLLSEAVEGTSGMVDQLKEDLGGLNAINRRVLIALGLMAEGTEDVAEATGALSADQALLNTAAAHTAVAAVEAAGGVDELTESELEAAEAADAAREAHAELVAEYRASVDPVFASIKAEADYEEALRNRAKVAKDAEASADDLREADLKVAEAYTTNRTALLELGGAMEDGSVTTDDLAAALVGLGEDAPEALQSVLDSARFQMADARDVLSDFGYDLGLGMAAGIELSTQAVADSLVSVMLDAKEAAQLAARIESPSKLFAEEIGRPLTEGIAEGILEDARAPASAIQQVMEMAEDQARDSLNNVLSGARATLGVEGARDRLSDAEAELRLLRTSGLEEGETRADRQREIERQQRRVQDAQLALIDQQMRQIEYGQALASQGGAGGDAFVQAAIAAGLTRQQAEALRRQLAGGAYLAAQGVNIPGLAHGGPVAAGQMYLVGEHGPELFTSAVAGRITPAGPTAQMMGATGSGGTFTSPTYVTANINMPPGSDGDDVVRAITEWNRRNGPIPVSVRG